MTLKLNSSSNLSRKSSKNTAAERKITAVLFDLDGTLVDSAPDLATALNKLLVEEGKPELPYETIRLEVSNGGNALVELGFGVKVGEPNQAELRQRLLDHYEQVVGTQSELFAGLESLLAKFDQQGIPWGIVTNKPRLYTDLLVANLGLKAASLVCPEDLGISKPSPEPVLLGAKQLQVAAENCIYVGDHLRDIQAGQAAGMLTQLAVYGYLSSEQEIHTWGADYLAFNVNELIEQLSELLHIN